MKKWLNDNKVFLVGLISAILVIVQEFANQPEPDYKAVGLAVIAGIGSYLAKNLRGQWASIIGVGGNMIALLITQMQNHVPISWLQVIVQAMSGFLFVIAPPAKSISYERVGPIVEAKEEAKIVDQETEKMPPPPVGK